MSESRVTILHVDDNETNRYVVTRILQNAGFTVVEAATGIEGLAAIGKHQPDLVILDVKLPDFSGFEICRQIKSNPEMVMIPVLHLSATFVQSQDKAEGLESGADGYLVQPVEPIELIATVRSLLRIRRAEESSRITAREWQTTFDAIQDSVCLVDREGKILRCNQSMSQLFGQPLNKLLGSFYYELMDSGLEIFDGSCFRQALETNQRQVLELRIKGRWFTKTIDPLLDENGNFIKAVFILSDITDRKQAELALQENEDKLNIGIQVAGVALARFDYTSNLVTLSPAAAAMYGLAANELEVSRERIHSTFHPDEYTELMESIAQALDPTGTGWFERDYRVVWPNGEVRWLSFRKQVFFDRSSEVHRPSYAISAAIDITARKRTEEALQESEDRFRTLANNISQLAWMTDADGWIFWYNRRWFDYTGTTLEQMQGWGWQKVHHPEHVNRVVDRFRSCIEAGEKWEDTFPLRGQDGTYRWFLSRAIPITDSEGRILRWFGTNTDVTDIKSAQAELEERNQALDSFVHIVSHDLKAPLRSISNLSQWIEEDLEGSLTSETQQQMSQLRSRVHRMTAMIDGLLNYARAGRTDKTIEQTAMAELLREVIDSLSPPPTFTIAIAPDLPTFKTKRLLLSQVLANLIGNAIKHHDRIDGSIYISVEDRDNFYEFAVADDGPGIDLEYQNSIFTIFQTGNPQNKKDSTGIGLAIVKKLVEAETGKIRLESQIGKGTTFYFTWPKSPI